MITELSEIGSDAPSASAPIAYSQDQAGTDSSTEACPLPSQIRIAVDTEFQGPTTLTVQIAARIAPDRLAVQVYRDQTLTEDPVDWKPQFAEFTYRSRFTVCDIRPMKWLSLLLSPGAMITDLTGIEGYSSLSRSRAADELDPDKMPPMQGESVHPRYRNVHWNASKNRWTVPVVDVTIVGHFLRADICRMFGAKFVDEMRTSRAARDSVAPVKLVDQKVLRYSDRRYGSEGSILEYLTREGELHAIRVSFADTNQAYGSSSLDGHSQMFLGVGKSKELADDEKARMADVFREKPAEAYRYAVIDCVNTLLVDEAMQLEDNRLLSSLVIHCYPPNAMPGTLGARVSRILTADVERQSGLDQATLRNLMRAGGRSLNLQPHASKFDKQVQSVHGGLLYSRSPTQFWHASPGQVRDIDLKACYNTAMTDINVYFGRPIIYEPGAKAMTLKKAIAFARKHADDDAWLVRVTGDFKCGFNALIPSTDVAVTTTNFRSRVRKAASAADTRPDAGDMKEGARLYTHTVRYGVVTAATWEAIQMLPRKMREEYEKLVVDTLMLYPRTMVANDAAEYRDLTAHYENRAVPWHQVLNKNLSLITETKNIGAEFVSFRYPLRDLMRKLAKLRQNAHDESGRGSPSELAAKLTANTVYGVLASRHKPTLNVMAANQVTARARAIASLIGQSLNAIQTITDGCTFRADEVPSISYMACLRRQPTYPIQRPETGSKIRFHRPSDIPKTDTDFNEWLRDHIAAFFRVQRSRVDMLFGNHRVEHKADSSGEMSFDALGCDGSGNYIKCRASSKDPSEGEWEVQASGLRGYSKNAKKELLPALVTAYSTDTLNDLPPIVEDEEILAPDKAMAEVRALLREQSDPVRFPLGYTRRRVKNYKVIKLSAFLFQTPEQRQKVKRQFEKFEKTRGCGLELLAKRRGYGNRKTDSISGVAEEIFRLIGEGKQRILRKLNADKLHENLVTIAGDRTTEVSRRKAEAKSAIREQMIDSGDFEATGTLPTAVRISRDNMEFLQSATERQ